MKIHDIPELRNRKFIFQDREHAGQVLAEMLAPVYDRRSDALVIGIPSGGVPVAMQIARHLELPMDLLIVRKIPIPGNTEAGFGAVTLSGNMFLNQELVSALGLTQEQIKEQSASVKSELARRNRLFRHDRPMPDVAGKTVIVADDGLASGFTMLAALHDLRSAGAEKLVVAVPTASASSTGRLARAADEIYCPNIRSGPYFAVAEAYQRWYDLDRDEVISMLDRASEAGIY
jgi:predicted phosphoribosyltransferase